MSEQSIAAETMGRQVPTLSSESPNIIVLDLETARSAESCRHCGQSAGEHVRAPMIGGHPGVLRCYAGSTGPGFQELGWDNKAALGLSIGCYYDYGDARYHFFDVPTLAETMRHLVDRQPLLVSFNGIAFDFALMRALLRHQAEQVRLGDTSTGIFARSRGEDITIDQAADYAQKLVDLCDAFKTLCSQSYDILAEIWRVDPTRKFERGLNSLDAISRANGLGGKLSHGAEAPLRWARGEYAHVINYCQDDVHKTKALFERICEGEPLLRGDGQPITLPLPLGEGREVPLCLRYPTP